MTDSYGRLLLPAALLGLLVIYGAGFSHHLTYDSLSYALEALEPSKLFFNPHHLLYNPVLWSVLSLAGIRPDGAPTDLTTLQAFNILVSLLAVATFYGVCRALRLAVGPALVVSVLFGMSRTFRTYSSQIEVYNLTALFLLLALLGLVQPPSSRLRWVLTPLAFFLSMCFHQTALFFAAAILVWELMTAGDGRLIPRLLCNLVLPGAAIGLLYLVVAEHLGYHGLDGISYWMTLYAHTDLGLWGKGDGSLHNLEQATVGLLTTFAPPRIVPFVGGLLIVYVVARVVEAPRRLLLHRRFFLAMIAWLVPAAVFTTWWTPWNNEFWLCPTIPIMMIAAGLGPGDDERDGTLPRSARVAHLALAGALLGMLAAAALFTFANRQPDSMRRDAALAPSVAKPGDLILTGRMTAGLYYQIYLAGRRIDVLTVEDLASPDILLQCRPAPICVADLLARSARATAARSGRVLVDRAFLDGRFGSAPGLKTPADKQAFAAELGKTLDLGAPSPVADGHLLELKLR
jgi:hypothetical protein